LKLKKLIAVEAAGVALVLILLVILVDFTSYLGSSNQKDRISLYVEKEYAEGNITVVPGRIAFVRFNYSSYEPAILVLELVFQSWESTGYLNIRCNNRAIGPIFASPENSTVRLNVVSTSGAEWVEPLSSMFGLNEVTFESGLENGFIGILSYKIKLRGSR
jgi:hypothetical protein